VHLLLCSLLLILLLAAPALSSQLPVHLGHVEQGVALGMVQQAHVRAAASAAVARQAHCTRWLLVVHMYCLTEASSGAAMAHHVLCCSCCPRGLLAVPRFCLFSQRPVHGGKLDLKVLSVT
jgi:hypothetical protein